MGEPAREWEQGDEPELVVVHGEGRALWRLTTTAGFALAVAVALCFWVGLVLLVRAVP